MRAWSEAKVVDIRSPTATRPWQHVLEPLSGYLTLASYLDNNSDLHGQAYNFGPLSQNNQSVAQLIEEMALYWKDVKWNDISGGDNNFHEAGLLKLNCDKALLDMKWLPTLDFSETIKMTTEWYREYYESSEKNMLHKTLEQIDQYSSIAKDKGMIWTKN